MKPVYEKVPTRETSSFFAYKKTVEAFEFGWHYHPEYEITAIIFGRGKRYVADSIDEYVSPDVVLLPPDMPHSWQSEQGEDINTSIVVQFSRDFMEKSGLSLPEFALIRRLLDNCGGGLVFGSDERILQLMELIAATDGFESFVHFVNLLNHLGGLSSSIISTSALTTTGKSRQNCDNVNRLFNYINDNFTAEITVCEAAKAVCMSRSSFCRFFKRISGRRFIDHINDLRVSLACRMLVETDKDITQICFEAGFTNVANFNRQFKRRKRQSPRQYRSLHN